MGIIDNILNAIRTLFSKVLGLSQAVRQEAVAAHEAVDEITGEVKAIKDDLKETENALRF